MWKWGGWGGGKKEKEVDDENRGREGDEKEEEEEWGAGGGGGGRREVIQTSGFCQAVLQPEGKRWCLCAIAILRVVCRGQHSLSLLIVVLLCGSGSQSWPVATGYCFA